MPQRSAEDERRALALFERLADRAGDTRFRERLTAHESATVLARLAALEHSVTRAENALPTLIPGSADCDHASPPPERIGAFRLIERIGRGGMGDVYAAERADGLFEQKVAIKFIQRHALSRAATAFEDERRFLARLEHPAITRLIDGGVTEDGLPWLAMEYFAGRSIDQASGALPIAARVRMFLDAAAAVQFAHGRGIAHADLKPSNIIVDDSGSVKLLDFGIAALIDAPAGPRGTGPLTREFASPQRVAGAGPSVADDVYALGRTLALTIAGAGDAELQAIAAGASHADDARRYASVGDMIDDLRRWQLRRPVTAMPGGWRYRAGKFVARHQRGVLAGATAIGIVAATSLTATASYVRAEWARQQADQRFIQVRSMSHYMLFDLYDMLSRQPGTVGKRAQIAEKSARYLDELRAAGDAKPDLTIDTARSYRRLAAIEGLPYLSNLGRPDRAAAALDRAATLLGGVIARTPRSAEALAERGWVEAERWTLAADNPQSREINQRARRYFDRALAVAPGHASARLGRIATERSRAYDLLWAENAPAAALPVLKAAYAELHARRWPTTLAYHVRSLDIGLLNRIGDATYYVGDVTGSVAPYRAADALIDRAIAREGATPQLLIAKGEAAFNISGALGDAPGDYDAEAMRVADAGVATIERLLSAGPDAAAEKWLLVLYGEQALLIDQMGRGADALIPSSKSVSLREARLARSPANPQRMRDVAVGAMPHAELLAKFGRRDEACQSARRAGEIWAAIDARGNLSAFDRAKNLPRSGTLVKNLCSS